MEWMILIFFLFSSVLIFLYLFQFFFLSNKQLEKRMKYYLAIQEKKGLDRKKFNLLLQIQLFKQRLRRQMMHKQKNLRLEQQLSRAGIPLKPEEYILFQWMGTIISAGIFYLIIGNLFFLSLGGITGYMLPIWWVKKKQRERILKFNEGLPDMITTIIGSLRAGFSFPQSLKTVVEESDSPIKEEIELVLKEMQYGSNLEDALHQLKERMPSDDLELMIQAILIQRQVGGNLATVLDKIVQTIRDRNKIQRQIMTLTAQGRLSGLIIGLLPIAIGLIIYLIEPGYIGTLFTNPVGIVMIVTGVIMAIVGFILIRKLTTIEV